jgi:hypothetical protein
MTLSQNQVEMFTIPFRFDHRILRDDTTVVFHFDLQLFVRQDAPAELENFRKPVRPQAMIDVPADMRLEHDCLGSTGNSAAIDEVLCGVADFRDAAWADEIAARQNKAWMRVRMF